MMGLEIIYISSHLLDISHRESAEKPAEEEEEDEEEEELDWVDGAAVSMTRGASHSGQGMGESECTKTQSSVLKVTVLLPALLDLALLLEEEEEEEEEELKDSLLTTALPPLDELLGKESSKSSSSSSSSSSLPPVSFFFSPELTVCAVEREVRGSGGRVEDSEKAYAFCTTHKTWQCELC
jgi:hypothetical protein